MWISSKLTDLSARATHQLLSSTTPLKPTDLGHQVPIAQAYITISNRSESSRSNCNEATEQLALSNYYPSEPASDLTNPSINSSTTTTDLSNHPCSQVPTKRTAKINLEPTRIRLKRTKPSRTRSLASSGLLITSSEQSTNLSKDGHVSEEIDAHRRRC